MAGIYKFCKEQSNISILITAMALITQLFPIGSSFELLAPHSSFLRCPPHHTPQ